MDDIVKAALAKWPNVPDCYGWLGLDARGHWFMRDDRAQASGSFASGRPGAKGSMLRHEKLIEFIARNYEADGQGRWYFQNGPQRVFVELEATPLIWRLDEQFQATAQTGELARIQRCVLDEHGRVYVDADIGFGLVHSNDVALAADAIESGLWVPEEVLTADLPQRFAYVRSPAAKAAAA